MNEPDKKSVNLFLLGVVAGHILVGVGLYFMLGVFSYEGKFRAILPLVYTCLMFTIWGSGFGLVFRASPPKELEQLKRVLNVHFGLSWLASLGFLLLVFMVGGIQRGYANKFELYLYVFLLLADINGCHFLLKRWWRRINALPEETDQENNFGSDQG